MRVCLQHSTHAMSVQVATQGNTASCSVLAARACVKDPVDLLGRGHAVHVRWPAAPCLLPLYSCTELEHRRLLHVRSPKDPTAEQEDAWFEIASGPDVATRFNLTTGENVTVTLSNYQQPPATPNPPSSSPGTNASATSGSGSSGTRRLLHNGLTHGRRGRSLLSNPAPVLEGFEKVGEGESSKEIWAGEPIYVRSSFYIVNFCGYAPSITKEVGRGTGNAAGVGTCPAPRATVCAREPAFGVLARCLCSLSFLR